MANKTLIPALKAKVGTWDYYVCMMKYAAVSREINFAHELGGNTDLSTLIQRGITSRTRDIVEYLTASKHRFLGALIVAAWGGNPIYSPVQMEENEELLNGLDNQFGVLTFDGTQQYFALDGQHRLRAIKDAIKINPELGSEEIAVILVSHYETEEGRTKTRRLFSNINKNAKSTTKAENIALDEDDGFAIIARRIITEHPFLKENGRVVVFSKQGDEGDIKLAGEAISKTHKKALTTLSCLYNTIKELGFDLDSTMTNPNKRPTAKVVDDSYDILIDRLNDLYKNCGNIQEEMEKIGNARELRAPKDNEIMGHAYMRPVIQRSIARVLKEVVTQGQLTWDEAIAKLQTLDWKISSPPWCSIVRVDGSKVKMTGQRDFVKLLDSTLHIHLAPPSKQAIKRAIQEYKNLKAEKYPVLVEELEKNIKAN
ncbi:DNA sulfur modification protein DndB [Desulfospira joergensenii]|uniref:DNA sulfur modification protein DndB n=1 Tax=Desulfospira joergensenii TaxID=53329 RepID=UPI0003B351CD|nr:DNA sulfur modification protein DndB [Desulfospira joergensenii]